MADIHKTQQEIAEEWLAIAIENWQEEIKHYGIGSTDHLYHSFHGKVVANASTLHAVELAYAWYGQMVDMGVGRGSKAGESSPDARRLLGSSAGRVAKPWYTQGKSSISFQTKRLTVLLSKAMANEVIQKVTGSISLNHTIKF